MDNNPSTDKAAIAENIARTVDKTALRKVRNLVDNFERHERAAKSQQFWVTLVFLLLVIGIFVAATPFMRASKAELRAQAGLSKGDLIASCAGKRQWDVRTDRLHELRRLQPNISDAELEVRLKAEAGTIYHTARQQCERIHAS